MSVNAFTTPYLSTLALHCFVQVPLATSHPPNELSYVLEHADVSAVLAPAGDRTHDLRQLARHQGCKLLEIDRDLVRGDSGERSCPHMTN